jgi:hypothetical protein
LEKTTVSIRPSPREQISINIPALQPVTNVIAEAPLAGQRAGAILAGNVKRQQDFLDAEGEENARKSMRLIDPNLVTAEEVVAAVIRKEQVLKELAPGDLAPAWAANLQASFDGLRDQNLAMSLNFVLRRTNQASISTQRSDSPLIANHKEIAGTGDALIPLILPAGVNPPPPLAVIPGVMQQPLGFRQGGCFPDTVQDLRSLSHAQILALVQYYNFNFGIQPGDGIEQRKLKVERYV